MDWSFGNSLEEKVVSLSGSAASICPKEITSGNQNSSQIVFECEDFPGPV